MPGTVSKSFTTSRGTTYNCQVLNLSVAETRDRTTRNRAFQADLNRLNVRNDVARKMMERIEQTEITDTTDIDVLFADIDAAAERYRASENELAKHLDSYDLLSLFVQSVDNFASMSDLPNADYQELVDLARDFTEGVVSGEAQTTEQ